MPLVTEYGQVQENAQAFSNIGDCRDTTAYDRFAHFQHWYYFPYIERGIFAPSKFIGYQNTTLEDYEGSGTGTDTEHVLNQWFRKCERGSQEYEEVIERLNRFAASIERNVNTKVANGTGGIHVLGYLYPEEAGTLNFMEGVKREVAVNAYERNPKARRRCLEHYGYKCCVCEISFEEVYGEIGKNFIHVHHLIQVAKAGRKRINPISELRPVCPNCHAMLHRADPPLDPKELTARMSKRKGRRKK